MIVGNENYDWKELEKVRGNERVIKKKETFTIMIIMMIGKIFYYLMSC